MRKIVNATYMTLDGDISNMQDWHFDYFGDQATKAAADQLGASDALIRSPKTERRSSRMTAGWTGANKQQTAPSYVRLYGPPPTEPRPARERIKRNSSTLVD